MNDVTDSHGKEDFPECGDNVGCEFWREISLDLMDEFSGFIKRFWTEPNTSKRDEIEG